MAWFTAQDGAREFVRLARRNDALFRWAGVAATESGRPASERVRLATVSRVVGRHHDLWRELVPESVLLEDARTAGEAAVVDWMPTAALEERVTDLLDEYERLVARLSAVSDGAARRVAEIVRIELEAANRGA